MLQAVNSFDDSSIILPLSVSAYFKSSVDTVLDSLGSTSLVSSHDLLDAYTSFSNKVKAHSEILGCRSPSLLALDYLKHRSSPFTQALVRDLRLAHQDPLLTVSNPDSSASQPTHMSTQNLEAHLLRHATNSSSLCRHALRIVSAIFKLVTFHSIFSEADLGILLDSVLEIALSRELPILNGLHLHSCSVWILQVQSLPLTVISGKSRKLFRALKYALQNGLSDTEADALKALNHLLIHYHPLFLPYLSDILPHVVSCLTHSSTLVREHAIAVLGRVVLISKKYSCWQESTSTQLLSYFNQQCSTLTQLSADVRSLDVFNASLPTDKFILIGENPLLGICALASLIILFDHAIFSSPRALKFCLRSLAMLMTHPRSIVRALHSYLWKCLLWSFVRLSVTSTPIGALSRSEMTTLERAAFYIVKQELGRDLGIGLIAALVGPISTSQKFSQGSMGRLDHVSQALTVVDEMVRSDDAQLFDRGVAVLHRLLSAIGTPCEEVDENADAWECGSLLVPALFDGTIMNAKSEELPTVIRALPVIQIEDIRQLSEQEIECHWDVLINIWIHCVCTCLEEQISSHLLSIWRSLLLVQFTLIEAHDRPSSSPHYVQRIATIVTSLIDRTSLTSETSQDISPDVIHAQLRQIALVDKLWGIMKDVITSPCLSMPAESILGAFLQLHIYLGDEGIRQSWRRLCADLIASCGFSLSSHLLGSSESQEGNQMRHELWVILASTFKSMNTDVPWQQVVNYLILPFGKWVMSDEEMHLWDEMLQYAISKANSSAIGSGTVFEILLEQAQEIIGDDILVILTSHLKSFEETSSPRRLLAAINESLCKQYVSKADAAPSLKLLSCLGSAFASSSAPSVVATMKILDQGLSCWIRDDQHRLSDDQYNQSVISLYCSVLNVLEGCSLSPQSLSDMASFLASSFGHVPAPALGPLAFAKFWRVTCAGHSQLYKSLPNNVRSCLKAFDDVYGGSLSAGLSHSTESQYSPHSIVPDSQSPFNLHSNIESTPAVAINDDAMAETVCEQSELHYETDRVSVPIVTPSGGPSSLLEMPTILHESARCSPAPPSSSQRTPLGDIFMPNTNSYIAGKEADQGFKRVASLIVQERPSKRPRPQVEPKTPASPATRSTSQKRAALQQKLIFDGVEVPTFKLVLSRKQKKERDQGRRMGHQMPSDMEGYRAHSPSISTSSEEYDNWEAGLDDFSSDVEVQSSSAEGPSTSVIESDSQGDTQSELGLNCRPQAARSISLGPTTQGHKIRSSHLNVLQDAYTAVVDAASQIPVEDLLSANKLVHRIGVILNEQMSKRFGQER